MAYVVMDAMREQYYTRKGLEGPFNFMGRVLYYDPKAGQYWDPRSDFYVEQDEMDQLQDQIVNRLSK
jgi:hypothetical protein